METLSQRLNVCQDKILEHYENDSKRLCDHIDYWKHIRLECVLMYKAREMGIHSINHQVVPALSVSKAKALQAIELQMMLETLNNTEYKNEDWTMQQTSLELYLTAPTGCLKKHGYTVQVQFDGDVHNTMHYTNWKFIYLCIDGQCTVVEGQVNCKGIYYVHEGHITYFVNFTEEAKKYGTGKKWEVHAGGQVIVFPESVFSSDEISFAGIVTKLPTANNTTTSNSKTCALGTSEGVRRATTSTKRPRTEPEHRNTHHPNKLLRGDSVDSVNCGVISAAACTNQTRAVSCPATTPIIHLKGDANILKCLRYRLSKYKQLYEQVSSTWHWTCTDGKHKNAIVTLTYINTSQRDDFLNTVKIPNTVSVSTGYMTI
uniref:Regulatory protein E2 n=1 Tax=Human papillomavirus 31 TaxID=10585 RepID=A0A7G2A776_HPV31|nr:early protein E2 [human papillomavirus 31]